MRELITAADFRDMMLCADAALHANTQSINELNVFPVPDGDTGTNMSLTVNNAATELRKRNFATISEAADCAASGLLRGARGNSGVITSLLFRGMSRKLKGSAQADAAAYSAAMTEGVDFWASASSQHSAVSSAQAGRNTSRLGVARNMARCSTG